MKKTLLIILVLLNISTKAQIIVNLSLDSILMDGVAVFFKPTWSNNVDLDDIRKIRNPGENIAIIRNGDTLAGEKRASYDVIPMFLYNLYAGKHALYIRSYIEGWWLQEGTKLTYIGDSLIYPFNNTYCERRFQLTYIKPLAIQNDISLSITEKANIYPNPANTYVNVLLKEYGVYTIKLGGKTYKTTQLNNQHFKIDVSSLSPRLHIITIINGKNQRISKKLIKL